MFNLILNFNFYLHFQNKNLHLYHQLSAEKSEKDNVRLAHYSKQT